MSEFDRRCTKIEALLEAARITRLEAQEELANAWANLRAGLGPEHPQLAEAASRALGVVGPDYLDVTLAQWLASAPAAKVFVFAAIRLTVTSALEPDSDVDEHAEMSRRASLAHLLAVEGLWHADLQAVARHILLTDQLALRATQAAAVGDPTAVAESVAQACRAGCAQPLWDHQAVLTPAQIAAALDSLDPSALLRADLPGALVRCAQLAVDLGDSGRAGQWLTAFPTHPSLPSGFPHGGLCGEGRLSRDQMMAAAILLDRAIGETDRSRTRAEACMRWTSNRLEDTSIFAGSVSMWILAQAQPPQRRAITLQSILDSRPRNVELGALQTQIQQDLALTRDKPDVPMPRTSQSIPTDRSEISLPGRWVYDSLWCDAVLRQAMETLPVLGWHLAPISDSMRRSRPLRDA